MSDVVVETCPCGARMEVPGPRGYWTSSDIRQAQSKFHGQHAECVKPKEPPPPEPKKPLCVCGWVGIGNHYHDARMGQSNESSRSDDGGEDQGQATTEASGGVQPDPGVDL